MNSPSQQNTLLLAVAACFLFSGFAALLYQTAWLRQFSIVFGTSELAVATVLAAYMFGLAVGAIVADRWMSRITRPVFAYGVLEAGIAVSALAVPLLLHLAELLYIALLGGQAELPDSTGMGQSVFYLLVAFVVLALPTGFMGATLPLLTRYVVRSDAQIGPRVAFLYAINTLGAVLGTLVTAFLLLPALGLFGTVLIGVSINFMVFLIAVRIAKSETAYQNTANAKTSAEKFSQLAMSRSSWILPVIGVSGIASFSYEVLWTRMLGHVLGGSVYAFATMLASFLSGIAIGSALASRFSKTREQAALAFVVAQVGVAVASIFIYLSLDRIIPDDFSFASRLVFAASAMLPAALFIGATFPLAVRVLAPNEHVIGNSTARVYAWNTVGAIVGAIAAGFWIIPLLGFSGTVYAIVMTNLALAVVVAGLIVEQRLIAVSLASAACLAVALGFDPQRPEDLVNASYIDPSSHKDHQKRESELFYAVGRSATVLLKERDGEFYLRTNGLPEASIARKGKTPQLQPQHWMTALPALSRPSAESMLVIGLGGGVALESVPPSVKTVDVVELEPEVIAANQAISTLRDNDPLQDDRVRIVTNDARSALLLSDQRFDIIVSQPSHPWTAAASHLYTREFVQLVHDHLTANGVFLQWISWHFVDAALLKSLVATLSDAFENVRLYQHSPGVLYFLASDGSLAIERSLTRPNSTLAKYEAHYAKLGALVPEDIAYALTLDEAGTKSFAQGAPLTSDNFNRLAMSTGLIHEDSAQADLFEHLRDHLAYTRANSTSRQLLGREMSWLHLIQRMLSTGLAAHADLIAPTIEDPIERLTVSALIHRHRGETEAMYSALWQALERAPNNEAARFLLIQSRLGSLAKGTATPKFRALADKATGIQRAIVDGWRFAGRNDWNAIARLEPILATARPNEPWFAAASQLRAQWRISSRSLDFRLKPEAVKIIDQALSTHYNFDLVLIRLGAAVEYNDEPAIVETANLIAQKTRERIIRAARGDYQFDASKSTTTQRQLDSIIRFLSRRQFSDEIKTRAKEVISELQLQRSRLSD